MGVVVLGGCCDRPEKRGDLVDTRHRTSQSLSTGVQEPWEAPGQNYLELDAGGPKIPKQGPRSTHAQSHLEEPGGLGILWWGPRDTSTQSHQVAARGPGSAEGQSHTEAVAQSL